MNPSLDELPYEIDIFSANIGAYLPPPKAVRQYFHTPQFQLYAIIGMSFVHGHVWKVYEGDLGQNIIPYGVNDQNGNKKYAIDYIPVKSNNFLVGLSAGLYNFHADFLYNYFQRRVSFQAGLRYRFKSK